ncbi:FAD-linked oxidase C-terminal domain-containing protein [Agrococcus sp. Marseille-Q4369]|uniref:FAD-binding oxidoreductase n=1 Tax=Agrococcus sp. Marseille-Q4369 TaxID=2810513 RepID=UPI001B8BC95F|nr:FAD-linked oxidase C-terminal domain-containing protein [Agrococcus sp. Marseille-Q4369]QUW18372.1 FAD-binding protein [Agrococcus sp. Marseille-Q4369]
MSLDALRAALPEHVLVTDPAALEIARADKSGHRSRAAPLAIVEAEAVEHVQAALRWASEHRVPVVPRAAGTGLAGGAIAGEGELVVSVDRMRRLLDVSLIDQSCVVEPGIRNAELGELLAAHGLWWPPDPASRAISTVGGNIATNAGGLLCAKYGVTREWVLALDVVLADGSLISTGHRTVKGVTGLDLTALMIGSEGTLGIVVGATLKLRPLVEGSIWTVGAFFDDEAIAAAACTAVTAARIRPAIMELVGRDAVSMLAAYTGQPMEGAFVLVQTDDLGAAATSEAVAAILAAHGGRVERTDDAARSDVLVQVRRQVHFALESFGTVLVEDVSVPRSRLADMFRACDEASARHGVRLATTAHAGDGNLHPTFVFDGTEPSDEIWACANEVFEAAIAMGGTLTGEHGVGILKRRWLVDELGERQLELQRAVRAAFDPLGILNPGKAV